MNAARIRDAVGAKIQQLLQDNDWEMEPAGPNRVIFRKGSDEVRYFDYRQEHGHGPEGSLTKEEYDALGGLKPQPGAAPIPASGSIPAAGPRVAPPPPPGGSVAGGARRPPPPPPLPGAQIPPVVPQSDLKGDADRERKVRDDELPLRPLPKNEFVERLEGVMANNPGLTLRELQGMIEAGRSVLFAGATESAQDAARSGVRFAWLSYGDGIVETIKQCQALTQTAQSKSILRMLQELSDMQKPQSQGAALSPPSPWQENALEGLAGWIQAEQHRQLLLQENERLHREAAEVEARRSGEQQRLADAQRVAAEAEGRRLAAEAAAAEAQRVAAEAAAVAAKQAADAQQLKDALLRGRGRK